MTNDEKSRISEMRKRGCTYARIAELLSIPESTIKTYCRRTLTSSDVTAVKPVCKQCGCPIEIREKYKPRRFCSEAAAPRGCRSPRYAEGRVSPDLRLLGKPFVSSGNRARKYCSHQCCITARFGGGGNKRGI